MSVGRPALPALSARLTVTAGAGREAFTVESELSLDRGLLVLFGPSGAGKSLTLQALAGLIAPARGQIVTAPMTPRSTPLHCLAFCGCGRIRMATFFVCSSLRTASIQRVTNPTSSGAINGDEHR